MGLRPRNLKGFSMLMVVISVLCKSGMYAALPESFPNMYKALRSSPSHNKHWWVGAHLEPQQVGRRGRRFRNSRPPQLHRAFEANLGYVFLCEGLFGACSSHA